MRSLLALLLLAGCGPGAPPLPDGGSARPGFFCKDETIQSVCLEKCAAEPSSTAYGAVRCDGHGGVVGTVNWDLVPSKTWAELCSQLPPC